MLKFNALMISTLAVTAVILISFISPSLSVGGVVTVSASIESTGAITLLPHHQVQYTLGEKIFDENGNEVVWRAVGGSYLFHTSGDGYVQAWMSHLPQMKEMGLNAIRLVFRFPFDSQSSADVLDYGKLQWILSFLAANNMTAILDNHGGSGFGGPELIAAWKQLAAFCEGNPTVAAFELFNEPYSSNFDPTVIKSKLDVLRAYANLTTEIRTVDPDHINIWQSDLYYVPTMDQVVPYLQSNIVFTAHRWWTNYAQEFSLWSADELGNMTVGYLSWLRQEYGIPVWMGEFGTCYPYDSSNPEWLVSGKILNRCEDQGIGWSLWMGSNSASRPWDQYVNFFPMPAYNSSAGRKTLQAPSQKLVDYVQSSSGLECLDFYRIEMWHGGDYSVFNPGISLRVIVSHKISDGTTQIESDQIMTITNTTIITNIEDTPDHPGDWNTLIYRFGS
jgi:hypothetical protein